VSSSTYVDRAAPLTPAPAAAVEEALRNLMMSAGEKQ
jgi:hypothetical protein